VHQFGRKWGQVSETKRETKLLTILQRIDYSAGWISLMWQLLRAPTNILGVYVGSLRKCKPQPHSDVIKPISTDLGLHIGGITSSGKLDVIARPVGFRLT
jgi:hypothetical protein